MGNFMNNNCGTSEVIEVTCLPEMCEADAFYYSGDCSYDADNSVCNHG